MGEVEGVVIYAPEYLRRLYPGDQGARLEVVDEMAESLSVETELGVRLALRGTGIDSTTDPEECAVPAAATPRGPAVQRPVVGSLPPELEKLRLR